MAPPILVVSRRAMRYHLFVIGGPYTDAWWARNLSMGVITAGFDNEIGDRGSIYLRDMDAGASRMRQDRGLSGPARWAARTPTESCGSGTFRRILSQGTGSFAL